MVSPRVCGLIFVLVVVFCNSLSSTPELFNIGSVVKLLTKLSCMYAVYFHARSGFIFLNAGQFDCSL